MHQSGKGKAKGGMLVGGTPPLTKVAHSRRARRRSYVIQTRRLATNCYDTFFSSCPIHIQVNHAPATPKVIEESWGKVGKMELFKFQLLNKH